MVVRLLRVNRRPVFGVLESLCDSSYTIASSNLPALLPPSTPIFRPGSHPQEQEHDACADFRNDTTGSPFSAFLFLSSSPSSRYQQCRVNLSTRLIATNISPLDKRVYLHPTLSILLPLTTLRLAIVQSKTNSFTSDTTT